MTRKSSHPGKRVHKHGIMLLIIALHPQMKATNAISFPNFAVVKSSWI
jgi:hypothetical protein